MSLREEQCNKVCTILDNVLANRPTERDSLIVAVRKAFAETKRGKWIIKKSTIHPYGNDVCCSICGHTMGSTFGYKFCPMCGADMRGEQNE